MDEAKELNIFVICNMDFIVLLIFQQVKMNFPLKQQPQGGFNHAGKIESLLHDYCQ